MATTFETPLIVEDEAGNRFLNREKVGEEFFALNADDYPLLIPAGQSLTTTFQTPEDAGHAGDMEVAGLIGRATVPFLLSFDEVGVDASGFMNVPIHHQLCVGAGGLPFVLKETALWLAGRTIRLTITNLSSTLAGNVFLTAIGRRFTSEMKPEDRACRRDFLNDEILFEAKNDAIGVKLYDAQSGRDITYGYGTGSVGGAGFIDLRTFGGTGRIPAQCLGSPIVQPRRAIRAVFNENSGASNTLYFAAHGR